MTDKRTEEQEYCNSFFIFGQNKNKTKRKKQDSNQIFIDAHQSQDNNK